MPKILLLGTSRLHRPFAKRVDGRLITNIQEQVELIFAKMGYFHSAAEILQAIRFMKNPDCLQKDLLPYIFRIEPRPTTPLNEFDPKLESAIRQGLRFKPAFSPLQDINYLVMEVSSLSSNTHSLSGCVLHTNPNILKNVSYADIYPEGYYKKFEPEMSVLKIETGLDALTSQLGEIKAELPHVKVIVLGHLRSSKYTHIGRDVIHRSLMNACSLSGCVYFDTAPFLDEYGHASVGGARDIHHLSHEGEHAIGNAIQERIQSMHFD